MKETDKTGISIVVPTLNEEANVAGLISRIANALGPSGFEYEIVIVDDNSSDSTREIVTAHSSGYPVRLYLKQGEKGKARSLLEGFAHAEYPVIGMIDADLQYPPEAIPAMLEKIRAGYDVVQSRRITHGSGRLRAWASVLFNAVFIRLLHNLNLDTQSGLKVFRKEVLAGSELKPTPWTFDLEFLINAKHGGFKIASHDILFADRLGGESKISVLAAAREIGMNALKLKLFPAKPRKIESDHPETMRGAGYVHKGKRYVTHSTLHHEVSAIRTLVPWQKLSILLVAVVAFASLALFPLQAAVAIVGLLSVIYFTDVLFNFYVVAKSLNAPPELSFAPAQLAAVDDAGLPIYTILCPLYREAHVLPGFLEAIAALDWPKDRLDVQLLLEEDDQETIAVAKEMELPAYVRVVVVPHSMPKTKPKACNYGLTLATGEYLVIYDAEDIPEPDQLKKAYLGFQQSAPEVVCLQAKLNYFNPHHNILTRLFTAEYSLWFDVILPGLQSMNGYIPLGGTSNHFRTNDLKDLQGWDPFNVTEDCDLGARLFKRGSRTAIIDSTTLEEANSNLKNWIRQRSRWIKGYMMTYLVHMRRPVSFFRESGIHAALFQLVVGGKIAFMLINPVLWALTITYFAARTTVGQVIEQLYPPAIFYIAVVSLVAGNFLYLYYYMIGCAKRGHWDVIKYVYLVPVYWLLTSMAAVMAFYQLVVKPHFWEKTNHGLHLKKAAGEQAAVAARPGRSMFGAARNAFGLAKAWSSRNITGAGLLIVSLMVGNFLNFVFNAYLGRQLSYEQFGLVTFYNTLLFIFSVLFGAMSSTVNHRTAYLNGKYGQDAGQSFMRWTAKFANAAMLITLLAWLALSPVIAHVFRISDLTSVILFSPILIFGMSVAISRGYIQGNLRFVGVSLVVLMEPLAKLLSAGAFVHYGRLDLAYLSLPISLFAAYLIAAALVRRPAAAVVRNGYRFPRRFMVAALVTGLSTTAFLSLDLVLVKMFMDPAVAGQYSILSLVGKMVYFLGTLLNGLMITFVSRDAGERRDASRTFSFLFGASALLVLAGITAFGVLGAQTIPLLLGEKALSVLPYLLGYTVAIGLFALSSVLVIYHLAREQYSFSVLAFGLTAVMCLGIVYSHGSIGSVVDVIFWSSLASFAAVGALHLVHNNTKFILANILDLVGVFQRLSRPAPLAAGGKRMLIFNWRDTKHVMAGGAEVYVHELAKRWVKDGHQVTLFCGNDGMSLPNEMVDGVRVIRRGGFYMVYLWAFIYYVAKFRGNFDVIIDCHNGIPFFTPLYAKEKVYAILHHIHQEVFYKHYSRPVAWFAAVLENRLMPYAYRNVKFVTVSPSTKKTMEDLDITGQGIEIVYCGVDLDQLKPGEKSLDPMVLYLGRLKAYKSVDVLIRAFQQVLRRVPNARLVIAGSGEESVALRALAARLNLGGRVEFTGKIDDAQKVSLMQKAWVFVNPSMVEGWGITTIEANACGTPVVASNVPGLRDSVKSPEAGFLVRHADEDAFAEKISEVLEDAVLRKRMSESAVAWANNFNWDTSAVKGLEVLNA